MPLTSHSENNTSYPAILASQNLLHATKYPETPWLVLGVHNYHITNRDLGWGGVPAIVPVWLPPFSNDPKIA